jgi:hypothetical protein
MDQTQVLQLRNVFSTNDDKQMITINQILPVYNM